MQAVDESDERLCLALFLAVVNLIINTEMANYKYSLDRGWGML